MACGGATTLQSNNKKISMNKSTPTKGYTCKSSDNDNWVILLRKDGIIGSNSHILLKMDP